MHHLIFEGAELTGKSWLMSQVYDCLEPRYNRSSQLLDGCHWFNCDNGIFGSAEGKKIIRHYTDLFSEINDRNIIVEKFHLSDIIYNKLVCQKKISYGAIEKKLSDLGFKIVLASFREDEDLVMGRLKDRLNLYPNYDRIKHDAGWYIKQQQEYIKQIKKTKLPYLIVETDSLPDQAPVKKILDWIGE